MRENVVSPRQEAHPQFQVFPIVIDIIWRVDIQKCAGSIVPHNRNGGRQDTPLFSSAALLGLATLEEACRCNRTVIGRLRSEFVEDLGKREGRRGHKIAREQDEVLLDTVREMPEDRTCPDAGF